jgi:hypothetical protein
MHGFAQWHALHIWDHEILLFPVPACTLTCIIDRPCSLITFIASCRPVTNQMHACMARHAHQSCRSSAGCALAASYSCCSVDLLFSTALHHARLLAWRALDYLTWCVQHASYLRRDKLAVRAKTQSLPSPARGERERGSKAWSFIYIIRSSTNIEARCARRNSRVISPPSSPSV